jgi:hypothetical protein
MHITNEMAPIRGAEAALGEGRGGSLYNLVIVFPSVNMAAAVDIDGGARQITGVVA